MHAIFWQAGFLDAQSSSGPGMPGLEFLMHSLFFKKVYLLVKMAGPPWSSRARDFFLVLLLISLRKTFGARG